MKNRAANISKRIFSLLLCFTLIFAAAVQGTVLAEAATGRRRTGSSIISQEEAIEFACKDVGVETEEAEILTTEIVYEYGLYAYKICMAAKGVKYFYHIDVFNGSVIKTYSYVITYKNKSEAAETAAE